MYSWLDLELGDGNFWDSGLQPRPVSVPVAVGLEALEPDRRLRLTAELEERKFRRYDKSETLAYDFFRIL